jgi:hypothetical protein
MKKLMMTVVLASFGFVGCADLCAKQAECAKKSGDTFSQTQCTNDAKESQERSESKGCGAEYSALSSCAANLSCTELRDGTAIQAECGAQYNKYAKCME